MAGEVYATLVKSYPRFVSVEIVYEEGGEVVVRIRESREETEYRFDITPIGTNEGLMILVSVGLA